MEALRWSASPRIFRQSCPAQNSRGVRRALASWIAVCRVYGGRWRVRPIRAIAWAADADSQRRRLGTFGTR
jgi:hypothetical protein